MPHAERHRTERIVWRRAAVLGDARDELGITAELAARPLQAALGALFGTAVA
jgi:hypothetical protein